MQEYRVTAATMNPAAAKADFIVKTYQHLLGAILLFVGMEWWLFTSGMAEAIVSKMAGVNWLLILGAFMLVSWVATHAAHAAKSRPSQYLALFVFVLAWAVMFVPVIYMGEAMAPGVTIKAAIWTGAGFTALTMIAFFTRKDFSFLRGFLMWGSFLAIGAIAFAVIGGASLGLWFSVAMIGFAGAAVLYDTSNVLHQYNDDQYVGAALQLFASIALMLWYMMRFLMSFSGD